jgi:hypothetical protein
VLLSITKYISKNIYKNKINAQLVGYAVIDAYDGSGQLIVKGKDTFSQMFFEQYKDNNVVNLGLSLAKPALISAPLTFNEAEDTRYMFDSDFADTERTISKFFKDFGSSSCGSIFEWEGDDTKVNYGIMNEVNGIAENHYVSIEVDSNS